MTKLYTTLQTEKRMQHLYKFLLFTFLVIIGFSETFAQETQTADTSITSIDADLINIFNQKAPKKYTIAAIKVTGNKFFDENLLISIASISVGDEVTIPGGDQFSKAITKLWGQNYFSNVEVFITRLAGKNIDIEIAVTERPTTIQFFL